MVNFAAVVFNPNIWTQFPHVISAGLATASFFVLGISAYHLLRLQENRDSYRRSFQIAAIIGILGTVGVIMTGHSQMQHLVDSQPMKVASAEALWDSEDPAGLSLFTIGDTKNREDVFAIRIPGLLSLLALDQLYGEVQGINNLQAQYEQEFGPGNYVPPVFITYWSFRAMVGAGFLMLAAMAYALLLVMGEQLEASPRFLKFFIWLIPLPYIANTTGWLLTEFGRFPWIVYGLMKIADGVSITVPSWSVGLTLIGYTLIYAALMVATVYLLAKYARRGDGPESSDELIDVEPAVALVGD
jgi:cytochrome d ubiquinol oxidase subunit I